MIPYWERLTVVVYYSLRTWRVGSFRNRFIWRQEIFNGSDITRKYRRLLSDSTDVRLYYNKCVCQSHSLNSMSGSDHWEPDSILQDITHGVSWCLEINILYLDYYNKRINFMESPKSICVITCFISEKIKMDIKVKWY